MSIKFTNIDDQEYDGFWTTTTTNNWVLKKDPYNFVGGFGFNKPSSQSLAYLFLKEAEDRIHLNRTFRIDHILKNGDYTTVIWKDGTKTIVKKASDEPDDPEKALLFAMLKKVCNDNGSEMSRYLKDAEEKTIVKKPKKKSSGKRDASLIVAQVKALRDQGYTYKQISEELQIPTSSVRYYYSLNLNKEG